MEGSSKKGKNKKKQKRKSKLLEEAKLSMTEEKSPLFQIKDIGKILNVADGIAKATQYIEMLDFEQGIKIYESLLNEHENDTLLLDSYAEFLLSIDDQEKAFQFLEKSIKLQPEKNGRKYLSIGGMLNGKHSLACYEKGIQLLQKEIESLPPRTRATEIEHGKKQIASALATIAELYMTDLCEEKNAEITVEEILEKALELDKNNLDALQCLTNLRILRGRDEEAKDYLNQLLMAVEILDINDEIKSIDFQKQTGRLCMELQEHKSSIKVETWYLLGFSHWKNGDNKSALECVDNVESMSKGKGGSQEILSANLELKNTLLSESPGDTLNDGEKNMSDEENEGGYQTYSEEEEENAN